MNIEEIIELSKLYKTISEFKIQGVKEVKEALIYVAEYIVKKRRILYGGMAIDLALKSVGHIGIYKKDVMPDYDFYSPMNLFDSIELAGILNQKFHDIGSINGLHPTTRRVRINKVNYIADISYYPEPYYSNIPILFHQFYIVSPHFQRIDLHRSICYLYEGAPAREAFKNRLNKDIMRLNLLETHIPIEGITIDAKPIKGAYMLCNFGRGPVKFDIKKYTGDVCYAGIIAYKICRELIYDEPADLTELEDCAEIFMNDIPQADIYYEKTVDIYPEAGYAAGHLLFYNYGELVAAVRTKYGWIVNIHHLCYTFLFKYFMLCNPRYLELYLECVKMMKEAEAKKGFNFKDSPFAINGYFFGKNNIYSPFLYAEKGEHCNILKKKYIPRPQIGYTPNMKPPSINPEAYEMYKCAGREQKKIERKSLLCTI